ncbi:hypothetical protein [Amycolatopsis rhizosphaerae]|nr:hypothetical protein [Amycolatopsis rhizosphaerae]
MLDHQARHGHLPADQLRELGRLLGDLAERLIAAADDLSRPMTEIP